MPLRLAVPPRGWLEAVQATLGKRVERSDLATKALRGARAEELFLAVPHPVYTLGLRALVKGEGVDAAELTGWRYLVQRGEKTVASAELHGTGAGADPRGLEVNEGPFVRATETAIEEVTQLPHLADATYELRLLRIPAVYVVAIWLKADDGGGGDLLVPIGATPPEVEAGRPYSPDELFAAVAEPARRQLEFDSSPTDSKQQR